MHVPPRSYGSRRMRTEQSPVPVRWSVATQRALYQQEAGGAVLLAAAVAALALANGRWSEEFASFWHAKAALSAGPFSLQLDLHHWVNDGLMAIFFFAIGLEIKHELLHGGLASPRKAALPVAAALGGMIAPALIYLTIAGGAARGWGIVMATDIAFALAVLAVLGSRVPPELRLFLLALAVVDDVGSIFVIAFFYTGTISWTAIGWALVPLVAVTGMNWLRVRSALPYAVAGVAFWYALLQSGVHATLAGVIFAAFIPARAPLEPSEFLERVNPWLRQIRDSVSSGEETQTALGAVTELGDETESLLDRFQTGVYPWVAFLVLPLFALANSGIDVSREMVQDLPSNRVALAVIVGLVLGKSAGISLFTWIALRIRIAELPAGVSARHLAGIAMLGGIGFTVSLFIAELAFADPVLVVSAKVGILIASTIAAVAGFVFLHATAREAPKTTGR